MKKKFLVSLLAALIGTLLMAAPVFADDSYQFTDVKDASWKCNGVQYRVKYKADHFNVVEYGSTGLPVSSTPLQLDIPKNTDSWASVAEVKSDSGLVYINVDKWYQDSLYCFDQKSKTAFLAQEDASVLVKGGSDYFIGSSRTPTDISPRDYAIYKYTDTGCEKVKMLTSKGAGATYKAGKFYYGTYPLPDRKAYGDYYPDMHKMQIYQINTDGTGRKLLKTVTTKNKNGEIYPESIHPYSANIEIGTKKKNVYYTQTDDAGNTLIPNGWYEGHPGAKSSNIGNVYKFSQLKDGRLLIAGTLYGAEFCYYGNKTRVFKVSNSLKVKAFARLDNRHKDGTYNITLKKLCYAYKHKRSNLRCIYFYVKNNQITKIVVESRYRI